LQRKEHKTISQARNALDQVTCSGPSPYIRRHLQVLGIL